MKAAELFKLLDKMLVDLEFEYMGISGVICPFSQEDIAVKYGDQEHIFDSLDALMNEPFIDGKPLKDICEQLDIWNY